MLSERLVRQLGV